MKLDKEIKEKRPELASGTGLIFHQDNAKPHTSLVIMLNERWQKFIEQNGQYIID